MARKGKKAKETVYLLRNSLVSQCGDNAVPILSIAWNTFIKLGKRGV